MSARIFCIDINLLAMLLLQSKAVKKCYQQINSSGKLCAGMSEQLHPQVVNFGLK
jgi:hypothetical protein